MASNSDGPGRRPPNTRSRSFLGLSRPRGSIFRVSRAMSRLRSSLRNAPAVPEHSIVLSQPSQLTPIIVLERPPMPCAPYRLRCWEIVNNIVTYESNYLRALLLLTRDCYDELMRDESVAKRETVQQIFAYLPTMQELHQIFRDWMAECAAVFEDQQTVGWLFGALLEQPVVLQTYCLFVANYKRALAVMQAEMGCNNTFRNFIESRVRHVDPKLNFEDFFMKPIQRMVHMELQLGELIGATPDDHPDMPRMRLARQRVKHVVTQLDVMEGHISSLRPILSPMFPHGIRSAPPRNAQWRQSQLLHWDDLCHMFSNHQPRSETAAVNRIFLFNDRVVCAKVLGTEATSSRFETKLAYEFAKPLLQIELLTTDLRGVLCSHIPGTSDSYKIMADMSADVKVLQDIMEKAHALCSRVDGLSPASLHNAIQRCNKKIIDVMENARTLDECYYSTWLVIREQSTASYRHAQPRTYFMNFMDVDAKLRWYCNARLAQRAVKSSPHSPVWWSQQLVAPNDPALVDKLTMFNCTQTLCGCYFAMKLSSALRYCVEHRNALWMCARDGYDTRVTIYSHDLMGQTLTQRSSISVRGLVVECIAHVPDGQVPSADRTQLDSVWLGGKDELILYSGAYPMLPMPLLRIRIDGTARRMLYRPGRLYVGLDSGYVLIYVEVNSNWSVDPLVVPVRAGVPIAALLSVKRDVLVAAGPMVYAIDGANDRLRPGIVNHDAAGRDAPGTTAPAPIIAMAYSVHGVWLVRQKSTTVSLYRLAPWKHLQDIDVVRAVQLYSPYVSQLISEGKIYVTSVLVVDDSLWLGTSVGVTLMLALPQRRNVPLINDFLYAAKHGHLGPVDFLLPLLTDAQLTTLGAINDDDDDDAGYDMYHNCPHSGSSGSRTRDSSGAYDNVSELLLQSLGPNVARSVSTESDSPSSRGASELLLQSPGPSASPSSSCGLSTGQSPSTETDGASSSDTVVYHTVWTSREGSHLPSASPGQGRASPPIEPPPPPSVTGALRRPPRAAVPPRRRQATVADVKVPTTVMILSGGVGYQNWHNWENLAAPPPPFGPSFPRSEPHFDDDNGATPHICVWEKRLNTPFYNLE